MTKKIAVINDLSSFGRCSLTAAISVLAAMGVQACPLPTAVLSAQTGYDSYYCDDYSDKMEYFLTEWRKMDVQFDGIYTGFVAGEQQIDFIHRFVDIFYTETSFLLVDPVMGDNGHTYDMFSKELCKKMRTLSKRADIITPNLTELCLLADIPYENFRKIQSIERLTEEIHCIAKHFSKDGPETIIVTGIHYVDASKSGRMANYYLTGEASGLVSFPYIGESYSGTGDLFASCIAAGIARQRPLPSIIEDAGRFLEAALLDSAKHHVPRNDGINYEKYLSLLMQEN